MIRDYADGDDTMAYTLREGVLPRKSEAGEAHKRNQKQIEMLYPLTVPTNTRKERLQPLAGWSLRYCPISGAGWQQGQVRLANFASMIPLLT